MGKKKSETTSTESTEFNPTEVKQFLEELETLQDHPILLLSAYGLVEWHKELGEEQKSNEFKKACKVFNKMNKALGLDKLHDYYQTRINHKLAPTPTELWTAWTMHTTQPFTFSGSRLKHASLCLGKDYRMLVKEEKCQDSNFFILFFQLLLIPKKNFVNAPLF